MMRLSVSPHSGQLIAVPHSVLSKVFRQFWHLNSIGLRATGSSLVAERVRYTRHLEGWQRKSAAGFSLCGRWRRQLARCPRLTATETLLQRVVDTGVQAQRFRPKPLHHVRRWLVAALVVIPRRLTHDVGTQVGDRGLRQGRDRRRGQPNGSSRGRAPEEGAPDDRRDLL